MKQTLPKVKACIEYVESCGFTYIGRVYNSYRFSKNTGKMPNGNVDVGFTLKELRDKKICGW